MKHLLFLSFLLNISCFEAEKSEDEEEEDSNAQEGNIQGDCLDGEDNDDDGYIDCDDSGCTGKPACDEDPDAINGAVQIAGYMSQNVDYGAEYEELGYSDCESSSVFIPAGEAPHAADCPSCDLTGLSEYDIFNSTCAGTMPEAIEWGVDRATETVYYYTPGGEWYDILSSDSCSEDSEIYLMGSSYEGNCWTIHENGNDYTTSISLSWE